MIPPRQRRASDPIPVLPDGSDPPATRFPDDTRPFRPHGPPVVPLSREDAPHPPHRQRRAVDGDGDTSGGERRP